MKTTVQQASAPAAAPALIDLGTLQALGSERFEDVCASAFKHTGFFVEPTGLGPSYGIDLIMATIGQGGYADDWVAMRCVYKEGPVTAKEAIVFMDAMESEGFDRGIIVTSCEVLPEALEAAAGHTDLQIIDGGAFVEKLSGLPQDAQEEVAAVATAA
jgi:hypothetical protein